MPILKKSSLLLFVLAFAVSTLAYADVDRDKDKDKKKSNPPAAAYKGVGQCDLGGASADLSANNVRARLYNNGGLFWIGGAPIYEVPKGSGSNAIFASGIWLGGLANGEDLRMAAATYSDWEFWPGPLDENGNPPADCSVYDRMYTITRADIQTFQSTGEATDDMRDWPADLGAPVIDGDGNPNNYSLANGDLPELIGDQTTWWVMNDAGNTHNTTETPPIGLEAQVTAFAFNQAGALGNTTFYRYKLIYKGDEPLTDFYFGLWSDPDLGDAGDDYVGSDSTLGLGYVYNGDGFDGGSAGYGDRPPALGYDFFQGPLVNTDGVDNDRDGEVDEDDERIGMQKFVYYNNDGSIQGNPGNADEYYGYLKGEWRDGTPITFGGSGLGFSNIPASYMFPADPPRFWSEDNIDGQGTRNPPADRRFLQSSGPFTFQPGDEQEIVFGIVWSQGQTRIASTRLLELDDVVAQGAFNLDFDIPRPPDPPRVEVTELDGQVILNWGYEQQDNNYLNSYQAQSPFLVDENAEDQTLDMQGYIIYEYTSPNDQTGEIVDVLDRQDNVTNIFGNVVDPGTGELVTAVLVPGTDQGIKQSITINNSTYSTESSLRNYTEYYFGVQAYAYNPNSEPAIYSSPIVRVTAVPSKQTAREGGSIVLADSLNVERELDKANVAGGGVVEARVVDPAVITGDTYRVEFYTEENGAINYNIVNSNTGETVIAGADYFARTGAVLPQGTDAAFADGLAFSITGSTSTCAPIPAELEEVIDFGRGRPIQREFISGFVELDAEGNVVPGDYTPEPGVAIRFYSDPVEFQLDVDGDGAADAIRAITQVSGPGGSPVCEGNPNGPSADGFGYCLNGERVIDDVFTSGYFADGGEWSTAILTTQSFATLPDYAPSTYEVRFTEFDQSSTEVGSFVLHLFTSLNVAKYPVEIWDIGAVAPGEANDPSDDVKMSISIFSDGGGECEWGWDELDVGTAPLLFSDRLYAYYYGEGHDYTEWAESVVPFVVPIQPGDAYTIDTSTLAPQRGVAEAAEEALDLIGVVPNPYRGSSAYEVSRVVDVVRFTNLPEQATIRVFTLNGTLVRTLEKNSPETYLAWDLNTTNGLPIASGLYLVHVEVPGVGEKVLKFAVVKKRVQLNEL